MYQIAIIGAGQLGSRHLQGLKTASLPLSITVMDSSEESLRVAKERYDAVAPIGEKKIRYITSLDQLPSTLDLVIVATGAKPRASIIKSMLSYVSVRYMILEKVLFTQLSDYDEIGSLLKDKGVICWVNCPRRMFGSYNLIKNRINSSIPIKMEFIGNEWGLCCNTMHFIDVFMFLTQEEDFTINTDGIESKIYESKRPGYIEMNGTLKVSTSGGSELMLISSITYKGRSLVEIKNGMSYFALDEVDGVLTCDGKNVKVDTPYQSQTTGYLTDGILKTGYCPLSLYDKSAKYHKFFIAAMLDKYNEISGENSKQLPIT